MGGEFIAKNIEGPEKDEGPGREGKKDRSEGGAAPPSGVSPDKGPDNPPRGGSDGKGRPQPPGLNRR